MKMLKSFITAHKRIAFQVMIEVGVVIGAAFNLLVPATHLSDSVVHAINLLLVGMLGFLLIRLDPRANQSSNTIEKMIKPLEGIALVVTIGLGVVIGAVVYLLAPATHVNNSVAQALILLLGGVLAFALTIFEYCD